MRTLEKAYWEIFTFSRFDFRFIHLLSALGGVARAHKGGYNHDDWGKKLGLDRKAGTGCVAR